MKCAYPFYAPRILRQAQDAGMVSLSNRAGELNRIGELWKKRGNFLRIEELRYCREHEILNIPMPGPPCKICFFQGFNVKIKLTVLVKAVIPAQAGIHFFSI